MLSEVTSPGPTTAASSGCMAWRPGSTIVAASDPAFARVASSRGTRRYSPTYHPGVPFADQAKPVTVSGTGQEPRVEFKLQSFRRRGSTGRLVAEDGKPLLNGAIIMGPAEGDGLPMVPPRIHRCCRTAPSVSATCPRPLPDPRARPHDAEGTALFGVFSIEVIGTDLEGIHMTLRHGASSTGRSRSRHAAAPSRRSSPGFACGPRSSTGTFR